MKFILMISTLLVVMLGANFYIFFRLWHLIPPFPASKIILVTVAALLVALPFITLGLGNHFPLPVASIMYRMGTSWIMIMLYLVILFLVLDIIRATGFLHLNRFMFNNWTGFIILTLIMVGFLLAGNINYHHKKRVELNIKTNKNITIDKPLKIVAIADLHLGYGIGTEEFRSWVKLINQEEPDVVLIAGDAIDNSLKPLREKNFAPIFREIKTKHGIFMVPGNHEYISNITKSIDFLTHAGITILRDSVAMIDQTFYIVGRDDRSNSHRKTVDELTAALDPTKPIILLDHQPFNFNEVEKNQIDLFFAGHTHDGQAWPISLITKAMYEISHGYLKKGNTHFYVTSGIGIWGGKFRIGSGSEYVVVRLD